MFTADEMNALQDKVAAKHRRKIERLFDRGVRFAARNLNKTMDVRLPEAFRKDLSEAVGAMWFDTMVASGQLTSAAIRELKAESDEFYDRVLEQYISLYGARKVVGMEKATVEQMQAAIRQAAREGLSVTATAKKLRERAPVLAKARSILIARTETHAASMYASTETAKESGIEMMKEWVSVSDDRTRDSDDAFDHEIMDGVQVPMDQPFRVPSLLGSDEEIMFPGDPSGSPANVINCRCSQVYVRV